MKYNTGPYSSDSPLHNFCKSQGFEIKTALFDRYGLFCYSELTPEEAVVFRLRFPNRPFWTDDDFNRELLRR